MSSAPKPDNGSNIEYLRNETKTAGNVQFTREVYLEPDGTLTQELGLWKTDANNSMLGSAMWQFKTGKDYGRHLANLDTYWQKMSSEFDNITSRARQYVELKTESSPSGKDKASIANIPARALAQIADNLLNQHPTDKEFATEIPHEQYTHLITINQRFKAVRTAAQAEHVKLDGFETAIMSLSHDVYDAIGKFDDVVLGAGTPDEILQAANGDGEEAKDDNEVDDEAWRESLKSDEELAGNAPAQGDDDDMDAAQDDEDDQPIWQAQDADSWKSAGDPTAALEFGTFGHDDADSARDGKLDELVQAYLDKVNDFMDAAEFIWLDAATHIQHGTPVALHKNQIEGLKTIRDETQEAYDNFKEAAEDLASSSYELRDVYDALEDPDNGPIKRMQQIISLASRPDLLEDTIKKGMPPKKLR